jgi:hypothetical protein
MPEYGLLAPDEGQGLLPWSWAVERLMRARNYWVATTQPHGRPHVTAVWGLWFDESFYFSTGRQSRKARNLADRPHCVVCTEDAAEAVIVEGSAALVGDPVLLRRIANVYRAKYASSFPDDSNVYMIRPQIVFGFIESAAEFAGTATRWRFA